MKIVLSKWKQEGCLFGRHAKAYRIGPQQIGDIDFGFPLKGEHGTFGHGSLGGFNVKPQGHQPFWRMSPSAAKSYSLTLMWRCVKIGFRTLNGGILADSL